MVHDELLINSVKRYKWKMWRGVLLFYLLAVEAFLGKLLVVAGGAVDVIALGQEALRTDRLPAFQALEAVLVPYLVLVLHALGS